MAINYQKDKKCWRAYTSVNRKQVLIGTFKERRHAELAFLMWDGFFTELRAVTCQSCGVKFNRSGGRQRYCGSVNSRSGCSWKLTQEKQSKIYQRNKIEIDKLHAAWSKANPDRKRVMGSNRRAKLFAGGTHTLEEWEWVKECFNYLCVGCNEPKSLTLDHKHALAKGGSNTVDNLQPLCKSCNSRKHVKTMYPATDLSTKKLVLLQPS